MAETTRSQYQHFVPQFILRNFSHPYKPRKNGQKNQQRPNRKGEKRMYRGDPVVNTLDLSAQPPTICEERVDRILGNMDMYRDASKPFSEQQEIEQMFSRMEGQASAVFRKITKAFEQKEQGLWLTRQERDLIRKFLFLLKYRGSTFHQRFYHDVTEDYKADDRELLWEYMKEKGFKRPMDVWFNNLKTIMELHMDPGKTWIQELPKHMYVDDAMWFIFHVQSMYMAICTPSDPTDEFILTDNCYNIFEGPNSLVTDKTSGKLEAASYTPLHEFAPISPKLMIVLRSFLLPVPEENAHPTVKAKRDFWYSMTVGDVYKGEVKSLLSDLPITKAQNNYSAIIDGRVLLNPGEDGNSRKDHSFCFKYFPIHTQHVHTISAIFLQNAYICSRVVFGTKESFSRTLEAHLVSPWNLITGDDADLRLAFLKQLGAISKSLGSKKEPVWEELPTPEVRDNEGARLNILEMRKSFSRMINKDDTEPGTDNKFMQLYMCLGGSEQGICEDVNQAGLMWKLRVKIDSWSQGVDESIRQRNRMLLTDAYLRLPPRRVWLYVKQIRIAHLEQSEESETLLNPGNSTREPEDIIAQGKSSQVIKPKCLAQLMYKATMNDIWIKQRPEVALWAKIDKSNEHAREQLILLNMLNSTHPQSVRDCGIDSIEQLARNLEIVQVQTPKIPLITVDEERELLTRIRVRSKFNKTLSGRLEPTSLKALKQLFFEVLYPAPVPSGR